MSIEKEIVEMHSEIQFIYLSLNPKFLKTLRIKGHSNLSYAFSISSFIAIHFSLPFFFLIAWMISCAIMLLSCIFLSWMKAACREISSCGGVVSICLLIILKLSYITHYIAWKGCHSSCCPLLIDECPFTFCYRLANHMAMPVFHVPFLQFSFLLPFSLVGLVSQAMFLFIYLNGPSLLLP